MTAKDSFQSRSSKGLRNIYLCQKAEKYWMSAAEAVLWPLRVAKKNPGGTSIGLDRWGKEYSSFNKTLCENNAKAEGTSNISFVNGNAVKLDFPDESFDAVTSNYVYHNIPGRNKQELLDETLRVLKKGGIFGNTRYYVSAKIRRYECICDRAAKAGL